MFPLEQGAHTASGDGRDFSRRVAAWIDWIPARRGCSCACREVRVEDTESAFFSC